MITIISEKPSVAREIAKVLNVTEQHDGYWSLPYFFTIPCLLQTDIRSVSAYSQFVP